MRCWVLGLLGLIPVIGIGPAVMAVLLFRVVQERTAGQWNPARAYALGGLIAAGIGLAGSGLLFFALIWVFVMRA